ncbi:MAG: uL22 family ribosomal protein [Candidatus Daviesbacteria bacterium]|nr:uL22 family ribosomal protein [Candidatus Daviesbacteria bacterium]
MEQKMENLEQKNKKSDEKKQKVPKTLTEEKTTEIKKPETQPSPRDHPAGRKKIKKNEAVVNIQNAPVSTKYSMGICKFIKNKKIEKAINDLEQVLVYKKAIPMRGEVGHKKSAGHFASGSGKYPQDATKYFIKLLKSLSSNASVNGLENPIIVEAFANIGQKPRARFGRWKRKRTHLRLVARDKKTLSKKENKLKKEVKK